MDKSPEGYVKLIGSRDYIKIENLQTLQENVLPLVVRQAFLGWKNYFIEGSKINDLKPTFSQIQEFLNQYPHYARQYWRNIQEANQQKVAGLSYLNAFVYKTFIPDAVVPKKSYPPLLGLLCIMHSKHQKIFNRKVILKDSIFINKANDVKNSIKKLAQSLLHR